MTGPAAYEIRVEGHLDDHWAGRLGGLVIVRSADGTTALTGRPVDQAELYGVLAGLRDIGATLISVQVNGAVRRGGDDDVPAGGASPPRL